ncbi:TolC family protein [Selenomonas sp.]|uniref:TolC family protein n=1 Tax=Selenomonas sp. TaxID=2053611 RepID=UPI0025D5A3CC|nr:TolC family protein [Selenomonas sp.]MCI6282900.1 TolC family protein [Selenomonas sp.]
MKQNHLFTKKLTALVLGGLLTLGAAPTAFAYDTVDLGLEDAIQMAFETNRSLKQSIANVDAARWNLSTARRQQGPTLVWQGTANRIGGDTYKAQKYDDYLYGNELQSGYSLDTTGKLKHNRRSAGYGLNAADLTLENTKQAVKLQTTQAYYQLLEYRNLIEVNQEAVDTLQEHLNNVNAQYRVGTVAKSDVLASEVQLANSQQSLVNAQNNYDVAMATLNNIIGLPSDTLLNVKDSLQYTPYDLNLDDCTVYALDNRPDGIVADYEVEQAKESVEMAKAGYRPDVSAALTKTIAGDNEFDHDRAEQWTAGFTASWNIFDNGVTQSSIETAKAALRAKEEAAAASKEQIQLDVRQQYLSLLAAEKNIHTTSKAVEQAEEDYKIAQVRYSAGVDTNLAVMDAQEKLTSARTNYYTALYNYNTSKAALDRAMGIPVDIDVPRYVAAQQAGDTRAKTLDAALLHEKLTKEEEAALREVKPTVKTAAARAADEAKAAKAEQAKAEKATTKKEEQVATKNESTQKPENQEVVSEDTQQESSNVEAELAG